MTEAKRVIAVDPEHLLRRARRADAIENPVKRKQILHHLATSAGLRDHNCLERLLAADAELRTKTTKEQTVLPNAKTTTDFMQVLLRADEACLTASELCDGGIWSDEMEPVFVALASFLSENAADLHRMERVLNYWVRTRRNEN